MKNKSLHDCFCERFKRNEKRTAISFFKDGELETEISYESLLSDASLAAASLTASGVKKGDRVIFFLPKSVFFVTAYLAALKIGAIAVPLNPGFKKTEMSYLVKDADPALVLTDQSGARMVKDIDPAVQIQVIDAQAPYDSVNFFRKAHSDLNPVELKPDDPALIIYTSGTTGDPKGAVLTNRNLVHDAFNVIDVWEITPQDVLCHTLPLFHVHGLCFALHTALLSGAHVIMTNRFSPREVLNILRVPKGPHSCTMFMAVPPMYVKLMDYIGADRFDFSHMRLWTSGSAPLLVKDFKRIKEVFGKEPVEREGMTETGMNFSNPLRGVRKPGSIGLPFPGLQVRIVDPDSFDDAQTGGKGEFWLKSPSITPGYWRKPEETAEAFKDGWFRTGDLGKADSDGYYYLTDRLKHIIISGGENISPKEIEGAINRLEKVAESSVVGVPDEKWGEKVVAAVVLKEGSSASADEIKQHCKKKLHDWKCPKEIRIVKNLPRNTMGKILKESVKEIFG